MMFKAIVYKVIDGRYNEVFRRTVFADNTSKCEDIVKTTFSNCEGLTIRLVNSRYYPVAEFKM